MNPTPPVPAPAVGLRLIKEADLDTFFAHQQDAGACHMAAFTAPDPADRAAFDAHWSRIRAVESIMIRTIDVDGAVAGHVVSWEDEGQRELSYWLGRPFWGRGVATNAISIFLELDRRRPMLARAATDNRASIRVLEKLGFQLTGEARGFANARGEEIDEVEMTLSKPPEWGVTGSSLDVT